MIGREPAAAQKTSTQKRDDGGGEDIGRVGEVWDWIRG
jgi:hypothetical protein